MAAKRRVDAERLVSLGRVFKPHGITGELRFYPEVDDLDVWDGVLDADLLLRTDDGNTRPVRVESLRRHGSFFLMRLSGVPDRNAAEALGKADLLIDQDDLPPLEDNAFYHVDLEGLDVIDATSGESLGVIKSVKDDTAQAHLVVRPAQGRAFCIPLVDAFVGKIDLEAGKVEVTLPPGLMDL